MSADCDQICGWCNVAFSTIGVRSGNGQHFAILTSKQKSGCILWTIVSFCPGIMSFGVPKLAVVALLSRIMNPSKLHVIILWTSKFFLTLMVLHCKYVRQSQAELSGRESGVDLLTKTPHDPAVTMCNSLTTNSSVTGLCMLNLFGCVFVLFAQCTPARSQWDFSITDKSCWSPWVLVDFAIWTGGKYRSLSTWVT